MKKLLSILLSILLVSALAFSVTACKKGDEESVDENVDPVTMTIKVEIDDETDEETHTLTEFSLSAAAKKYVDENDYAGLKALFARHADNTKAFTFDANNDVTFTIPQDVTHIASNAISNQSFIKHIVIGDNVKEISLGAFAGVSGVESITLPFVGAKLGATNSEKVFSHIFGSIGGTGLTSVTQTFNDGAENNTVSYYVPTSLKKVIVTGDVKCEATTYNYYIDEIDGKETMIVVKDGETAPEGKTLLTLTTNDYAQSAVQPYAFAGVTTIESVEFKGAITEIPEHTFFGCTAIKSLDFTGSTIETIGKYAYANCTSLRTLTLGSVTKILEGAFNGCTTLGVGTKLTVNNVDFALVTEIGKDAFVGCSSLKAENILNLASAIDKDAAFGEDKWEDEEENA